MENQTISSFQFPPGVRFHPSDEELIMYYLLNKVNSRPLPAAVIGEVELYNYNPWDLPKKAPFGDEEWYFFSPRDRKYPNGVRPNRTAASGYWKATGTDKPILMSSSGARIGVKKALVFYVGKPPNGVKTDWIMIEYRVPDHTLIRPQRSKGSMRLDDWVLCRIRTKGNMSKNAWEVPHSPSKLLVGGLPNMKEQLPSVNTNNSDICSNYFLPEDCHLLAKLLATQAFPSISTVTRTTSHSGNSTPKNCNGVYVHGLTKDSQVINPYFDSSFNLQGKPNDENRYEDLSQSIKVIPHSNKNENIFLSNNMLAANVTSFFNQDESQGDEFKHNLSHAIMNLQELDMSAFAEKLLQ